MGAAAISALLLLAAGLTLALALGAAAWRRQHEAVEGRLLAAAPAAPDRMVDLAALDTVPEPAARFLRTTLTQGQPYVGLLRFGQRGELRQEPGQRWSPFVARQVVVPGAPGFLWDARARMAPGLAVGICDTYLDGHGGGRVALWSALVVARATGAPELDSAALLRYLAEAAWYPTALLPAPALRWLPRDESSATAEFSDGGTTVRLDFHFDAEGRIVRVESEGRYRRVGDSYELTPWRGRFSDHQRQAGMLIPMRGTVEWWLDGAWHAVWRGHLGDLDFDWSPPSEALDLPA